MKLINQISKETGIPIGTIRFYEKTGLFSGVKPKEGATNNYVYYTQEVIDKLYFIKKAKLVGFTLLEIKQVIDAWNGNKLSKNQKIEILDKKIQQIEIKISELEDIKKQILFYRTKIIKGF
jgi:MerR family transcriptional regulator, copper efflux regulator